MQFTGAANGPRRILLIGIGNMVAPGYLGFFAVILAYGIGSLIIGQLNDWLGATTTPLNMRYSMLLCPLACLIAAVSLWFGYRSMVRPQINAD